MILSFNGEIFPKKKKRSLQELSDGIKLASEAMTQLGETVWVTTNQYNELNMRSANSEREYTIEYPPEEAVIDIETNPYITSSTLTQDMWDNYAESLIHPVEELHEEFALNNGIRLQVSPAVSTGEAMLISQRLYGVTPDMFRAFSADTAGGIQRLMNVSV